MKKLKLNQKKIDQYQEKSTADFKKALDCATQKAKESGYQIILSENNKISNGRYDSIWYGGEVVRLESEKIIIYINAYGDVEADMDIDGCYATIKDRSNGGYFEGEFGYYLQNDEAYYQALNREYINLIDNNWWELTVLRKDNKEWIDQEAGVLDYGTITEVLNDINGIISWSEECYNDLKEDN